MRYGNPVVLEEEQQQQVDLWSAFFVLVVRSTASSLLQQQCRPSRKNTNFKKSSLRRLFSDIRNCVAYARPTIKKTTPLPLGGMAPGHRFHQEAAVFGFVTEKLQNTKICFLARPD